MKAMTGDCEKRFEGDEAATDGRRVLKVIVGWEGCHSCLAAGAIYQLNSPSMGQSRLHLQDSDFSSAREVDEA